MKRIHIYRSANWFFLLMGALLSAYLTPWPVAWRESHLRAWLHDSDFLAPWLIVFAVYGLWRLLRYSLNLVRCHACDGYVRREDLDDHQFHRHGIITRVKPVQSAMVSQDAEKSIKMPKVG